MSTKAQFIRYLGNAHINFMNLALYSSGSVRLENVVSGKSIAVKRFESVEAAENWFDAFNGNNTDRTIHAMHSMTTYLNKP